MGIFRAVGMELELESRSAGLSNADVFRGDVTAAASNPPVVVMKFLRLRECGAECGSMYVPRQKPGTGRVCRNRLPVAAALYACMREHGWKTLNLPPKPHGRVRLSNRRRASDETNALLPHAAPKAVPLYKLAI